MKNISVWASKNFILSRFLIFIGYLFLFLFSFFTGNALREKNILFPNSILICSTVIFVLTASAYIIQKYFLHQKFSYLYHKSLDGLLLISTYFILLTVYNQHGSISNMIMQQSNPAFGSFVKTEKSVPQLIIKKDKTDKAELKTLKKEKRQFFKNIISWYKSQSSGNKTLLIILSVIAALGLLTLIAALACSLSCSGSGALALLVALLGTFGIVYGLIKLIERINKGPKEPKTSS